MKYFIPIIVVTALVAGTPATKAAPISFGSSTPATSYTDVLNIGTTALAFDYYDSDNSSTSNVNGVVFSGSSTGGSGVAFTVPNGFSNAVGVAPIPGAANATYNNILNNLTYGPPSTTLDFENLTPEHTYELQIFAGSTGSSGTVLLQDGSASGVLSYGPATGSSGADFIIETFIPNGSTESITLSSGEGGYRILNAVNLRDVTAVPEPSASAMIVSGLFLLFVLTRKRRQELAGSSV